MAEGRARHAAYMDGALGRFGRNEFSILDVIDEETTEHIRANTEGGSYSSIGSSGNKHDEHLPHATTVPPDVAATSSSSDGAAAARLEEAAAPPCEEDLSLLQRIAVNDEEDSSERLRLVEGIERRADGPIHWQADAAPETVSNAPPFPPPPTYEEALREASMAVDEEAARTAAAASAPQLLSPPAPEQQQPQQDSSSTSLDDIVAEARRLGLDADFLSALPRDMALELLDEGRRESELLRDVGGGSGNVDVDIERSLSALPTAEQGGPDPTAMMEDDPPPFDYDVHAVSHDASSSPRSHHSSSSPRHQGSLSRHQEEESSARDDIASLRRTLTEAMSYASSSSPPTSLNGRWERHDPRRASPQSQSQSQPSQSQRTTRTTANRNNGGRRKRRKPSMMRAAIRDIARRDAGWRASELSRLYGGDHGP